MTENNAEDKNKDNEDSKQEESKVIDYSSADKPNRPLYFAFAVTWVAIALVSVYFSNWLNALSKRGGGEIGTSVGTQLEDIADKLDTLEKQVEANKAYISRISVLEEAIGNLPDELPATPEVNEVVEDNEANKKKITEITERVAKLEHEKTQASEGKPEDKIDLDSLVITVANLRERVQKNLSYQSDLTLIKKLNPGDNILLEHIDSLEKNLERNVPTESELKSGFAKIADNIVKASQDKKKEGFWDDAKDLLTDPVTIRKVGAGVEGQDTEAIVARAEAMIESGDFRGAVKEINGLEGEPAKIAESWLADAGLFLAVEENFSALYNRVTQLSAGEIPESQLQPQSGTTTDTQEDEPLLESENEPSAAPPAKSEIEESEIENNESENPEPVDSPSPEQLPSI